MIDISSVTERFLLISDLSQTDEKISALCRASTDRIQSILSENADEDDDRVINAAACDAFYQWTLIERATDGDYIKSFRAGDITVESDGKELTDAAMKLKKEAFDALAGLIADNGFYFGEVKIDDVRPTF